jgi:hypothetical protein
MKSWNMKNPSLLMNQGRWLSQNFTNKLREVAKSELHKVAAWPKLFPYTDMIRWALDHVDILTRTIYSHQKTIFDSF